MKPPGKMKTNTKTLIRDYDPVADLDGAARGQARSRDGEHLPGDLDDPRRVLARTPAPIMEPEAYYERFGLYIPNVVFPTGAVVVDGLVWLYYGCCDTAIALATCPLDDLLDHILSVRTQ